MSEQELNPELGDFVTILSNKYGTTTGRIVYRNNTLLRIKPVKTQAVVDFPIDEHGLFNADLGVTEIQIKEKRADPHFSILLNAVIGDEIELFDIEGQSLGKVGRVADIVATEEMDAIKLDNGKYLNFQFVGPKTAIGFIQVVVNEEGVPEPEQEPEPEPEELEEQKEKEEPVPEFVFNPDIVDDEELEEGEKFTYSDSVQRQDMFMAFVEDIPVKRQNDPKLTLKIFRTTDIFIALKNSVVVRDATGAIKVDAEPRSYIVNTMKDALDKQTVGFIPAILPVANVKKVLYVDAIKSENVDELDDAFVKHDLQSLYGAIQASQNYEQSSKKEAGFLPYIYTLFKQLRVFDSKTENDLYIETDQDVLRSQIPPKEVNGFPVLPILGGKTRGSETKEIDEAFVGSIQERYVRLLGPSRTKLIQKTDRKTTELSYAVAQADTAETVGHIVLSDDILKYRRLTRSSVLVWDIVASELSRKSSKTFYDSLIKTWDSQIVLSDEVSLLETIKDRIRPSLAFIDPFNTIVLDSFGLQNLELSKDIYDALQESTVSGQNAWTNAFKKLVSSAKKDQELPKNPVFSNMVQDSPLFSRTEPAYQKLYESYALKHNFSVLKGSDLSLASELLNAYSHTFTPYWYSMASGLPQELFPHVERSYEGEKDRVQNVTQRNRGIIERFFAKPEINSCVHVGKYEQLKRVKDDEKQMILFSKFLRRFNGGKNNSFVTCNVCKLNLCCMHEVLLLNEFNLMGNKDVLHKALLLEFAGPAFEGSYICKVCGQKIRELEFDTHLEFDDEGRPMVGRNVIEEEDQEDFDMLLKDETSEKQADFPFKNEMELYTNLCACFEACGMEVSVETHASLFKRAVDALIAFKGYLPNADKYEKGRKKELDKLKTEKQRREFERQYPPFAQYYANAMIGAIGAVTCLELQTSSISVPNPTRGCAFLLSGVPIEETGSGTTDYVTCSLVTKHVSGSIYSAASWSLETNPKKVTQDIQGSILFAIDSILQKKKAAALAGLTEIYGSLLADKRKSLAEDLPSKYDILPASFRPLQRAAKSGKDEPIQNAANFQKSVQTGDFEIVAPVVQSRHRKLNDDIINALNGAAKKDTVPNTNNPRSDGTVSFSRLGLKAEIGSGYKSLGLDDAKLNEIDLVRDAQKYLKRKDPAFSANGTHIFLPWSAPSEIVPVPEIDVNVLYKLFLKYCFKGPFEGNVHEFGRNYVCRRCNFSYPTELIYLTSAEISEKNMGKLEKALSDMGQRREAIILAKFREQEVTITTESFYALEENVRKRKMLDPIVVKEVPGILTILHEFSDSFGAERPVWEALLKTLETLHAEKISDEMDRKVRLSEFSGHYDDLFSQIDSTCFQEALKPWYFNQIPVGERRQKDTDKRPDEEKNVMAQVKGGFLKGTESPYSAVNNLMNMFVISAEQIRQARPNTNLKTRKWFPKINQNHLQELNKIWKTQAEIVERGIVAVGENEELLEALEKFSQSFGAFLRKWAEIKPTADFNVNEYTIALRWASLIFLRDLFDVSASNLKIINKITLDSLRKMFSVINKYQLSDEDIQLKITEREEKERNFFIKKIDVLDGEMRKIELMKKKLGLGDWNVSAKNLFSYNSDWWEHERDQRAAMGLIPEFSVTGAEEAGPAPVVNPYGDENDHRVREHEDE